MLASFYPLRSLKSYASLGLFAAGCITGLIVPAAMAQPQAAAPAEAPRIVVAEGEQFTPQGKDGWRVTPQDDTYGSHTYGGM